MIFARLGTLWEVNIAIERGHWACWCTNIKNDAFPHWNVTPWGHLNGRCFLYIPQKLRRISKYRSCRSRRYDLEDHLRIPAIKILPDLQMILRWSYPSENEQYCWGSWESFWMELWQTIWDRTIVRSTLTYFDIYLRSSKFVELFCYRFEVWYC